MFPTTPEQQEAIVKQAFYDQVAIAASDRIYPAISMEVPQPTETVTHTSFGSVPEPHRISQSTAGGAARSQALKDYTLVNKLVEWSDSVPMMRSVLEDNPSEGARISRTLGQKAQMFLDRESITQLQGGALGYDGVVTYSASHAETGSSQTNLTTTNIDPITAPTAAEMEAAIQLAVAALLILTDDQGTPVNDGLRKFSILIPIGMWSVTNLTLNPTMAGRAADVSGVAGEFRGMFTIHASALCPTDRFFIFGENTLTGALAYYTKTPWEFTTNIGTSADSWTQDRRAIFNGYSRWNFGPWDWKNTVRHIYT